MDAPDDRTLCLLLCRGDPAALALLYDRHGAMCYRAALATCGSAALAEDAVQDLFVRLARDASGPAGATNLAGYLLRMAQHAAIDQVRAVRRHARQTPLDPGLPAAPARADDEESRLLATALATLPPEQREVVQLRVWEDHSMEAIADRLGISVNTVASRWRYALDKLARQLKGSHGSR